MNLESVEPAELSLRDLGVSEEALDGDGPAGPQGLLCDARVIFSITAVVS